MDENKQCGNAVTKHLPYGCIKKVSKVPSLLEFNKILDRISHESKIGHLFVGDIKFYDKKKKMLFNEIYTLIFEINKVIQVQHRPVLQLMAVISRNEERDIARTFKANPKTHSTLEGKNLPLFMQNTSTF